MSVEQNLILILDEDAARAKTLVGELELVGYQVRIVTGELQGAAGVEGTEFGALIVDIQYPALTTSGVEFSQLAGGRIPVVFVSDIDDVESRLKAVRAGGNYFFSRPIDYKALLGLLEELTGRTLGWQPRILIVEDEETLALFYAQVLKRSGMISKHVVNPFDLLKITEEFKPDLVLMDINMPVCNGLELGHVFRQIPENVGIPIIFLTGEINPERRQAALSLGAEDFLTKPIKAPDLAAAVWSKVIRARSLNRARNVALEGSKAKTEFLSNMSHELRTPMNAILGYTEMLEESKLDEEQRKYLSTLRSAGQALLSLINNILDLSKIEARKLVIESVPMNLREMVEDVINMMAIIAKDKGISLTLEFAADVPAAIMGDPLRLRQVLTNLIGNAAKFTKHGGVHVKIEKDLEQNGHLRFMIQDTGIGIASDKIQKVFQEFTQVDASTTRNFGGTGLGLTISKRLIELMKGSIWVESEIGKGSRFYFVIPVIEAQINTLDGQDRASAQHEAMDSKKAKNAETAIQNKRARLLLVDDSEDNRELIKVFLKKQPVDIEVAENGEIAVQRFKGAEFDIVLMDMQMPVKDGYMATLEIREYENAHGRKAIPIFALTAFALSQDAEKCLAAGCTVHVAKPVQKAILIAKLQQFMPEIFQTQKGAK